MSPLFVDKLCIQALETVLRWVTKRPDSITGYLREPFPFPLTSTLRWKAIRKACREIERGPAHGALDKRNKHGKPYARRIVQRQQPQQDCMSLAVRKTATDAKPPAADSRVCLIRCTQAQNSQGEMRNRSAETATDANPPVRSHRVNSPFTWPRDDNATERIPHRRV